MKIYYCLVFVLLIAGCSGNSEKKSPDRGKVENGIYTNDFFSLQLTVPEGWIVQTDAEQDALNEESKNILKNINPGMKSNVDSAAKSTVQMLTVFERVPSDTSEFNASFVTIAEKLPTNIPGMDEKIYLTLAASQLRKSGLYTSIDAVPSQAKIGGENFSTVRAVIGGTGNSQPAQEFFAKKMDGYALIFILSYRTEGQHDQLKKVLESVTFR